MSAALPIAAARTARGAPVSHAIGSNASVAVTEPSDTYLVVATIAAKSTAAIVVASGVSTQNTPAATATPFPP